MTGDSGQWNWFDEWGFAVLITLAVAGALTVPLRMVSLRFGRRLEGVPSAREEAYMLVAASCAGLTSLLAKFGQWRRKVLLAGGRDVGLRRRHDRRRSAWLEPMCLTMGSVLVLPYVLMRIDVAQGMQELRTQDLTWYGENEPDTSSWSSSRRASYRSAASVPRNALVGALVIRSIKLQAPLYMDTSERHLNRGVGLIPNTDHPGLRGNVGIAGHRDGYFRALRNVSVGDTIEVLTPDRLYQYRVSSISIVQRGDASSLQSTAEPSITLVTCYPFYFLGRAPQRYVVRGVLKPAEGEGESMLAVHAPRPDAAPMFASTGRVRLER